MESGPAPRTQLRDSHHSPIVFLQLKNKWAASSCTQSHKEHVVAWVKTFLLKRLTFVGSLFFRSLQQKMTARGGICSCQIVLNILSQNEQDFVFSLVDNRRKEKSYIVTHNFLNIWLWGYFLQSELCLLSIRRSTSQSNKVFVEILVRLYFSYLVFLVYGFYMVFVFMCELLTTC